MSVTTTTIAAGQAVRHRTRRDFPAGRVHHVIGARAVVTWVRRMNKNHVRLENLEPIADAELVAVFHREEADPDRYAATSEENRRFLLGETASRTTRTVRLVMEPWVTAWIAWVERSPRRGLGTDDYDTFVAGYRAALDDRGLRTEPCGPDRAAVCAACRMDGTVTPATRASQFGDLLTWCPEHALTGDPLLPEADQPTEAMLLRAIRIPLEGPRVGAPQGLMNDE